MVELVPLEKSIEVEKVNGLDANQCALNQFAEALSEEWLGEEAFVRKLGTPHVLAMYNKEKIISFALLVFNESSEYLPRETKNRYGFIDWVETSNNNGEFFCCAVDICYFIIRNFEHTDLWSFSGDRTLFDRFGGVESVGYTTDGLRVLIRKKVR